MTSDSSTRKVFRGKIEAGKWAALAAATAMSAVVLATPVQARSAAEYFRARAVENDVPNLLSRSEQDYYRSVFSAIDQQDWSTVQSLLAQKDDGPLQQVAEAEYFLAPTSPKIELPQLETWLSKGRDLPFAEKIGSLAI
ncbi:MAG: lytic transglycosylase domain-containing protein, partial [Novosphingobium sp.]